MLDRLPRRRIVTGEIALVALGFFGYAIGQSCSQGNQTRLASSNKALAEQLGLTTPQSLRPVAATYRTRGEAVFADGTVLVGRSTPPNNEPTIRVAWFYRGSLPIRPEPFPLSLVEYGLADDGVRRTIGFNLKYTNKALIQLLADIAASNMAIKAEALAHLQDYCSSVNLGLRPGEQETITRFLNRV